jgi:hypothetical protein
MDAVLSFLREGRRQAFIVLFFSFALLFAHHHLVMMNQFLTQGHDQPMAFLALAAIVGVCFIGISIWGVAFRRADRVRDYTVTDALNGLGVLWLVSLAQVNAELRQFMMAYNFAFVIAALAVTLGCWWLLGKRPRKSG